MRAKVVALIDNAGGLINEEGFTFNDISHFFLAKKGNILAVENLIPFKVINKNFWIKKGYICDL